MKLSNPKKSFVKSFLLAILLILGGAVSTTIANTNICLGDFDTDGAVDGSDMAVFSADFGRTDCNGDCKGDFDSDGDVDGSDLAIFSADFGRTNCYIAPPGVAFSASPDSIISGESTTLIWTTTNAHSVCIDQGIGDVSVNGTVTVSPLETTSYTIIVTGSGGTVTEVATVNVQSFFQGCSDKGGDFDISINSPRDGAVISLSHGPCISVNGSMEELPESFSESCVSINDNLAVVDGNSFSGEVCLDCLDLGKNEILVEAERNGEECWEECWENCWEVCEGEECWEECEEICEEFCEPVTKIAWATICVYYSRIGGLEIVITNPRNGATVHKPRVPVEGIVSDSTADVTVNGEVAWVDSDCTFGKYVTLDPGDNTITAVADNQTDTRTDTITVVYEILPPAVRITDPVDGSIVRQSPITVSGTMDDDTALVEVNGIQGTVSGGKFTVENIALVPGTNTITATVTNEIGTGTDTIEVVYEEHLLLGTEFTVDGMGQWDHFGDSVSISGNYAIVGAYGDDYAGLFSGSAYIFKQDEGIWTQQARLVASDAGWDLYFHFGESVAISGDYAAVGTPNRNRAQGAVYVFRRDGVNWVQKQILIPWDTNYFHYFGSSVSISSDYLIVGTEIGKAFIFKRDGSYWNEQAKLKASDGAAVDKFGKSVFINGDHAIVGADGAAYVFKRDSQGYLSPTICGNISRSRDHFSWRILHPDMDFEQCRFCSNRQRYRHC